MKSDQDVIRLMLAYLCTAKEAEASLPRKVQILDRFGLTDRDIATVTSSSVQSVRNSRHLLKKKSHAR